MLTANRAVGVAPDLEHPHIVGRERVEVNHPADERLAGAEQQLDSLEALDRSDHPRQRSKHARLSARRRHVGGRWLAIEASITWPASRGVTDRRLAFEAQNRALHDPLLPPHP